MHKGVIKFKALFIAIKPMLYMFGQPYLVASFKK